MGFASKRNDPADTAAELRASARIEQAASKALRTVGLDRAADRTRRSAATSNVVARYLESDRCQLGHRDCTESDH